MIQHAACNEFCLFPLQPSLLSRSASPSSRSTSSSSCCCSFCCCCAYRGPLVCLHLKHLNGERMQGAPLERGGRGVQWKEEQLLQLLGSMLHERTPQKPHKHCNTSTKRFSNSSKRHGSSSSTGTCSNSCNGSCSSSSSSGGTSSSSNSSSGSRAAASR